MPIPEVAYFYNMHKGHVDQKNKARANTRVETHRQQWWPELLYNGAMALQESNAWAMKRCSWESRWELT